MMCNYIWKDIVVIGDIVSPEEHPISGLKDSDNYYDIDEFYTAVADKFGVDKDDIKTFMMDEDIDIGDYDISKLPYGLESCGCYTDGKPSWIIR